MLFSKKSITFNKKTMDFNEMLLNDFHSATLAEMYFYMAACMYIGFMIGLIFLKIKNIIKKNNGTKNSI